MTLTFDGRPTMPMVSLEKGRPVPPKTPAPTNSAPTSPAPTPTPASKPVKK